MTITQFNYVLALDKFKNFTKAAKACNVAQPTLSMQINKLEKELGVIIFNRESKPLKKTKIGKKLINQIKLVITETSKIKKTKEFYIDMFSKKLSIGISLGFESIVNYLPIKKLNNHNTIKIIEDKKNKLLNYLIKEDLDFLITDKPKNSIDLISIPFYYEPLMVLIPEKLKKNYNKKITLNDISPLDMIIQAKSNNLTKSIYNIFRNKKFKKNIISSNLDTIIKLSDRGMGLSIIPYLKVQELSDSIKKNIHHFKSPYPAREICFVYKKTNLKKDYILEILEIIKNELKKENFFSDVKII
ncbi:MAG: LysR family transcriptional regulator [Flavobacteriaceae bacterium]|nr:LysR family transcriptional regulator [Flavobacteriaceae bacterium]